MIIKIIIKYFQLTININYCRNFNYNISESDFNNHVLSELKITPIDDGVIEEDISQIVKDCLNWKTEIPTKIVTFEDITFKAHKILDTIDELKTQKLILETRILTSKRLEGFPKAYNQAKEDYQLTEQKIIQLTSNIEGLHKEIKTYINHQKRLFFQIALDSLGMNTNQEGYNQGTSVRAVIEELENYLSTPSLSLSERNEVQQLINILDHTCSMAYQMKALQEFDKDSAITYELRESFSFCKDYIHNQLTSLQIDETFLCLPVGMTMASLLLLQKPLQVILILN